jgi:hypothetical protein
LLELRDGRHAAPELLEGRVYARRDLFGLLHRQTVVDEPGKLEVAAASTAGLVQLEAVALGAALEDVSLVAKLELLLLRGQPVVPSSSSQVQHRGTIMNDKLGGCVHTYRNPTKHYLRRLATPGALEELFDYVLGHFHVHGLQRRRLGLPEGHVAIRSPDQGSFPSRKQCSRHSELESPNFFKRADRGVKLAPSPVKGSNAWREHPGTEQEQAVQCRRVDAGCRRPSLRLWCLVRRSLDVRGVTEKRTKDSLLGGGP